MEKPTRSSLVKILELEQNLGCRDTAVIGGLDAFVSRWKDSSSGLHPDFTRWAGMDREIQQDLDVVRCLSNYHQSPTEERIQKVADALRILRGETVTRRPGSLVGEASSAQSRATWDSLPSAGQPVAGSQSNNWVWAVVAILALLALIVNGLVPVSVLKVFLALLLIYLINRESTKRYSSKRGEKVQLHHGPLVSARWKEKSDRKTNLIWLWILLIGVLASIFQQ